MRIVVDARTLGSRPSGIGMYLNDFLKVLINNDKFEFILLSDVAESEYIKTFEKKGISVITSGVPVYKSAGVYSYFRFVQKELNKLKPDIFWEVNTVIPIRLNGSFKTMITIHDMFPIEYREYFGLVYSMYFKHCLKKTLKYTDMILYNSNQTRLSTERIFPQTSDINNCNAYIISHPLTEKPDIEDKGYMLYVGNMEKRKGVDLLLKAYACYRGQGGDKPLILAGKMQEEGIKKLLEETQRDTDGLTYMDYVSHDVKQQLFAGCSCFVFPSKAEGFGMPIIEIMKYYKPVITGNLEIYDEVAAGVVETFDIECDEQEQIKNLARVMKNYSTVIDRNKYDSVVARYSPERLGGIVEKFILEGYKK